MTSNYLDKKIYIAGHNGMVGSAVVDRLFDQGYKKLIVSDRHSVDLRSQQKVNDFMVHERPEVVIICAAKVGGILANNTYRAQFLYDNLSIASNLIHAAHCQGVEKLIFLGSSCIYPKSCPQPIKEEYLLTSSLEYTNEPYAIAKIAGLKMCESYYDQYNSNFYSIMPCNLFGENDNFDLKTSHVLPALIRKVHEAKEQKSEFIEVWGSGKPLREFLYVQDLARAVETCITNVEAKDIYSQNISHINIGSDDEVSIKELAEIICKVIGYQGYLKFDSSKPDGTMRKKMDNTLIKKLGFKQKYSLEEALLKTYKHFLQSWQS